MIVSPRSIDWRRNAKVSLDVQRHHQYVRMAYRTMRENGISPWQARYIVNGLLSAGMSTKVAQR